MSYAVLDASAILAFLTGERGSHVVDVYCGGALVSAVNIQEAAARLTDRGLATAQVRETLAILDLKIVPFDTDQALSGNVGDAKHERNLSFGERACLQLAEQQELPVLTADRSWTELKAGVEIRLIRA